MKDHKGKAKPVDHLPARVLATLEFVLGQKAVLRKEPIGIAHTAIFWGFIVITIGTLEQFVSTLYEPANFEFIGHGAYSALVFVQDLFVVFVLAGSALRLLTAAIWFGPKASENPATPRSF